MEIGCDVGNGDGSGCWQAGDEEEGAHLGWVCQDGRRCCWVLGVSLFC
jgi:hypothetical protein